MLPITRKPRMYPAVCSSAKANSHLNSMARVSDLKSEITGSNPDGGSQTIRTQDSSIRHQVSGVMIQANQSIGRKDAGFDKIPGIVYGTDNCPWFVPGWVVGSFRF